MATYQNKSVEKLAAELKAGLGRLRAQYVDATEDLLRLIEPDQSYPFDFVLYRITDYSGPSEGETPEPLDGKTLRKDLLTLTLDLCDSCEIHTSDVAGEVFDTPGLAKKYNVSTKTIQRWRGQGLPARRLIFPDGKRRIAFLDESVAWFVQRRPKQIDRSRRFTQMSDAEREQIIERARRLAERDLGLSDVAKRLAERSGRAVETIRYTIRRHDKENPDQAIISSVIIKDYLDKLSER